MTEATHYAIMRIGKIHNYKVLDAVEAHNTRKMPAGTVEGAPPPVDWVKMTGSFRERAQQIFAETGASWDKGKILAVEVLLTASPQWWANASREQKEEWVKANWRYAQDKAGPGLLSFIPHLDESTPHIQFVMLPLYHAAEKTRGTKPSKPESIARRVKKEAAAPKIWRLSFHELFGGHRDKLADLQTEYHGYVAHVGLTRGRDTRGLEIRHQTLKEYKLKLQQEERELFQRQKELDAEWAKIAEEREVRDHYNQQLEEKHRWVKEAEERVEKLLAAQAAQARDIRARAEALSQGERDLAQRLQAMEQREAAAAKQEAALEREQSVLDQRAREQAQIAEHQEAVREALEREKAEARSRDVALDGRERRILDRETRINQREIAVAKRERTVDTIMTQVGVLAGILTGRLPATWSNSVAAPQIDRKALSSEERLAMEEPVPTWLNTAMRHAIGFAGQRNRLGQRVQKLRQKLMARLAGIKQAELDVAATFQAAAAKQKVIDRDRAAVDQMIKVANQKTLEAERLSTAATEEDRVAKASIREADRRMAQADAAEAAARGLTEELSQTRLAVDEAKSELEAIQSQIRTGRSEVTAASEKRDAALAEADTSRVRREAEEAKRERLTREMAALQARRDGLEIECGVLRDERRKLVAEARSLQNERAAFDKEKEAHTLSTKLLAAIFGSERHARMRGTQLEVFPPDKIDGAPMETIDVSGFAPWLPPLVTLYSDLGEQRSGFREIQTKLTNRFQSLASQYPDDREKLQKQVDEDEAARAAILRRMHLPENMGIG